MFKDSSKVCNEKKSKWVFQSLPVTSPKAFFSMIVNLQSPSSTNHRVAIYKGEYRAGCNMLQCRPTF